MELFTSEPAASSVGRSGRSGLRGLAAFAPGRWMLDTLVPPRWSQQTMASEVGVCRERVSGGGESPASPSRSVSFGGVDVEAPKCFVSGRAAWVVRSRCLLQVSAKEDVKIVEDAVS